ncbi:pyroglutamyl peptidase [Streptomyces sp. NPDC048172]|uniref:pyroglutamyl peptidase n=1 Tax=Streptomyces sp. NPDC048172 TaxID=3365505 RepID=UPI00371B051C
MSSRTSSRLTRLGAVAVTTVLAYASLAVPGAQGATRAGAGAGTGAGARCLDTSAAVTVEGRRLERPAPREILDRSGFDRARPAFVRDLCAARSLPAAKRAVDRHAKALWKGAVERARDPRGGDDRPLYWARLSLDTALRQWKPGFPVSDRERDALLARLERGSRGQDSVAFPAGKKVKRILVTGFDPFTLDRDTRIGNPSGAAALALDGTTVRTESGPARIETVVFPVRWRDFAEGTVEKTLLPHFTSGPRRIDMFTTISQGRPGQFDVERFNGAWRGGFADNENASSTGTVPIPDGIPSPAPQPQWTVTSLPYGALAGSGTGRFPVVDHTEVTEIPKGGTEPVVRENGPTPGSQAREGGGGDYLSNEIAYRATLLRDALRLDVPGGHLHTPVLDFGKGNTDEITDPDFERNRRDITAQTRTLVVKAAGTLKPQG